MIIKQENENKPASALNRKRPAERACRKVTFGAIDLTGDEAVLMPPPPPRALKNLSASTGVLHNRSTNMGFVLEHNAKPIHQPSSVSAQNNAYTSPPEYSASMNTSTSASSSMRTSAITLLDTRHGRQRREVRNIPRREIQAAIKYGRMIQHPSNPELLIYTHNGKKHIVTKEDRRLVTTMATTVKIHDKKISCKERADNDRAMDIIHRQKGVCWNSHSVLVVDCSGSMRNSDVEGCRTRLGAVWLSIAKDFVDYRIKTGMADELVSPTNAQMPKLFFLEASERNLSNSPGRCQHRSDA